MSQTVQKQKIKVGVLIRDCEGYKKGTKVYEYPFYTYGAALDSEQAIMLEPGPTAGINCIARSAIKWTGETIEAEIPS